MKFLRRCIAAAIVGIGGLAAVHVVDNLPSEFKPWAPLNPEMPPGLLTRYKIGRMADDPALCRAFLDRAKVTYRFIGNEKLGNCQLEQQTLLQKSLYPYSSSVKATCPLIATLVLWERHIVAPAATQYFNNDIQSIEHYGVFSCRNIRGSSRLSQHAEANAIDISGFRLNDGRLIAVKANWKQDNNAGKFLDQVHKGACALFKSALGPDYNALHSDHFHLDRATFGICR